MTCGRALESANKTVAIYTGMNPCALILMFALTAVCARSQCPAAGEIDVNLASAGDLVRLGLTTGAAQALTAKVQSASFDGFADLRQFFADRPEKLPESLVVCPQPGLHPPPPAAARAKCPTPGEIDANLATAQDLVGLGLPEKAAQALIEYRFDGFNRFEDLQRYFNDQKLKLPEKLVVCLPEAEDLPEVAGGVTSALTPDGEPAVNVNSANAAALEPLRACGVDPEVLAQKNRRGISFADEKSVRQAIGKTKGCPRLLFRLSASGSAYRL